MKKTVLIILFSVAIIGCKKEKIYTSCNPLVDDLLKQEGDSAKQDWIKKNGAKLCALDLQDCILSMHDIKDAETFEKFAKAHTENSNTIRYYDKPWKEIKEAIANDSCYNSYVSFDMSSTTLKLKKVSLFSTNETCYSIPFFLNLEKKYELTDNDTIHFTKAIIDVNITNGSKKMEKVIFKITKNGMEAGYYDLSDFPGILDYIVPSGI